MKEEIKYALNRFTDALNRLKEGVQASKDELDKDGVIQRFEFTFELLWKLLKIYLENEGLLCNTPRECFKSAFKINLIKDEESYLNMLSDRNKTSHLYDKRESEEIYNRIKTEYVLLLSSLAEKFK